MHVVKHIHCVSICSHVLSVALLSLTLFLLFIAALNLPSPSSQEGGRRMNSGGSTALDITPRLFFSFGASTIGSLNSEPEEIFTTDYFRSIGIKSSGQPEMFSSVATIVNKCGKWWRISWIFTSIQRW